MRHIWICIIDGCLIRSGKVQPGETMPTLMEKLVKIFPHMASDSIRVICEDGRVFDSELWFANPTESGTGKPAEDIFAAVGVVDGFVGVKVHHGKAVEEVLSAESGAFSEKITDNMDFGIYDFSGDQVGSIEDMIALVQPPSEEKPQAQDEDDQRQRSGDRRGRGRRPRGRFRRRPNNNNAPADKDASTGATGDAPPAEGSDDQSQDSDDLPPEDAADDLTPRIREEAEATKPTFKVESAESTPKEN